MRVVTVARRPCSRTSTTANVVEQEAGAVNVDACRIGTGRWPANVVLAHRPTCRMIGTALAKGYTINRWTDGAKPFGDGAGHPYDSSRQPDEVVPVWECEAACPVHALGQQSGQSRSTVGKPRKSVGPGDGWGMTATGAEYEDSGTAARFFKQVRSEDSMATIPQDLWSYLTTLISPPPSCEPVVVALPDPNAVDWSKYADSSVHGMIVVGDPTPFLSEIDRVLRPGAHLLVVADDEDPTGAVGACAVEDFGYEVRDAIAIFDEPEDLHYVAKAPSKERHAGVTPRERVREVERLFPREGIDLDTLRAELEDSVKAKHLAKMETEGLDPEKVPEDAMWGLERRVITTRRVVQNDHSTVKPVAVMSRLLEDVSPGLVLDPFMGSGTTGLACLGSGHDFLGIEQDEGYLQIADERVRHRSRSHAAWVSVSIESEAPPLENEAEPAGGVFDMFGGEAT